VETQPTTEQKKGFLQNDRLVVCSMLTIYGLCILGAIAAVFWGLNRRNQTISTSTTATAVAISTQEAQAFATAVVDLTQQAQYELIDRFDSNENQWNIGQWSGLEWEGSQEITSGILLWDIDHVYQYYDFATVAMEIVPVNDFVKNYDTYVDTKVSIVPSGTVCSGLMFRKSPLGWETGGYSFMLCNAGNLSIHYHNVKDGWQEINSQYHPAVRPGDWNRLEIRVRDSHFVFLINNQTVYEMDDDRQPVGGVELMAIVEENGAQILFDNFGYQSR